MIELISSGLTQASLGSVITDAVAEVAKAFRYPVLILALIALATVAYEAGRLGMELWMRRQKPGRSRFHELVAEIAQAVRRGDLAGVGSLVDSYAYGAELNRVMQNVVTATDPGNARRAIVEYDLHVEKRLNRVRLLVRAGPALGLMGTLIPLAPALSALGRGDATKLADELQTAFAITVLGVAIGLVAFVIALARERAYSQDLADIEHLNVYLTGGATAADRSVLQPAFTPAATAVEQTGSTDPAPDISPVPPRPDSALAGFGGATAEQPAAPIPAPAEQRPAAPIASPAAPMPSPAAPQTAAPTPPPAAPQTAAPVFEPLPGMVLGAPSAPPAVTSAGPQSPLGAADKQTDAGTESGGATDSESRAGDPTGDDDQPTIVG